MAKHKGPQKGHPIQRKGREGFLKKQQLILSTLHVSRRRLLQSQKNLLFVSLAPIEVPEIQQKSVELVVSDYLKTNKQKNKPPKSQRQYGYYSFIPLINVDFFFLSVGHLQAMKTKKKSSFLGGTLILINPRVPCLILLTLMA